MVFLRLLLELALAATLVLWSGGSLLCALPWGRVRRALFKANRGLWFANWAVFGTMGDDSDVSVYALEFRDRRGDEPAPWIEAMCGRPWRWHAGLWQPQRRVADRLHRLGQDIVYLSARRTLPDAWLREREAMLANHLAAGWPPPPGTVREIRVRMRRSELDAPEKAPRGGMPRVCFHEQIVLEFQAGERAREP